MISKEYEKKRRKKNTTPPHTFIQKNLYEEKNTLLFSITAFFLPTLH